MKRLVGMLACLLGLTVFTTPGVAAGTSVAIKSWHVYTSDHKLHKEKPGSTFKACASKPTTEIDAKGSVNGATKGTKFAEIWSLNGHVNTTYHSTWLKNGNFTDYFTMVSEGGALDTGKWSVKLVQHAKTIGKSLITIRTKKSC